MVPEVDEVAVVAMQSWPVAITIGYERVHVAVPGAVVNATLRSTTLALPRRLAAKPVSAGKALGALTTKN